HRIVAPGRLMGARARLPGRTRISRIKTIVQKANLPRAQGSVRIHRHAEAGARPAISRKPRAMRLDVAPFHYRAHARIHAPPNEARALDLRRGTPIPTGNANDPKRDSDNRRHRINLTDDRFLLWSSSNAAQ